MGWLVDVATYFVHDDFLDGFLDAAARPATAI